jgi:two-component sensor histidine kinase
MLGPHTKENIVSEPQGDATSARTERVEMQGALDRVRIDLEAANLALYSSRGRVEALDAELQHRVRNILAVVRSIFSRTVGNADTLEHVESHFTGRLDALARYQLRATSSVAFDLEDMIHDTLMTYASLDHPRVDIEGPEVRLNGRTAESIGLALHELATNSIKFGMLSPSNDRGTLRIRWETKQGVLRFEWEEAGIVVMSAAPLPMGFGREFIEQGLPYQLGGETSFELSAGRLRCTLAIPLGDQDSIESEETFNQFLR